jgi:hypothetical protein
MEIGRPEKSKIEKERERDGMGAMLYKINFLAFQKTKNTSNKTKTPFIHLKFCFFSLFCVAYI